MLKKIKLGLVALLLPLVALAQSYPSPTFNNVTVNGTLTGVINSTGSTIINPTITGGTITGTTGVTQGRLDNSALLATDAFVNQQGAAAVATVPFANTTGGVFNQATLGSGAQLVFLASGGSVSSILSVAMGGTGYAVGDLLILPAGNSDALVRVTAVSSGAITTASIIYGGTGYMTGAQVPVSAIPPGRRAVVMTGTLTSNVTFIIQNGTYLTASREIEFINNTTGAFTVTVYLSNGADGHTGNGVVIPQGTNNSAAQRLYTDGVNDVWPVIGSPLPASVPLTSLATQAANTIIGNGTGSTASPTALAVPSCSTSSSALNWTSGTGFGCNASVNAATLGGATFAAPGPIGSTTASTGAFTTLSASASNPSFNYLGSGTGATARTYASKFGDTVSVIDFGADKTGVADSTSAIQSAITYALSLTNGGTVYLPTGIYKISSSISIPNTANVSLKIHGDGRSTQIKYSGSSTVTEFNVGSGSSVFGAQFEFSDFSFAQPTGGTVTAIGLDNINSALFYNVSIYSHTNGVLLDASYNTRFIGCTFYGSSQYGISTNVTGTNSLIVESSVFNTNATAINLSVGGNNIVIRDNDIEASGVALGMTSYTSVLFEGNYVENGTNSSFSFSGTNNAIDIRQNWFGANTTSTTIGNVTGGSFVNNTIYNSNWTFSNTFDMDSGGNILTGTATLASTPFQTTISYLNNWTAGGYTPGYKKSSNGIVELRGFVLAGTGSLGSPAFVLPAAYRPSQRKQFPIIDLTTSTVGTCIVDTNGNVAPNVAGGAGGNGVSLDGIMFNAGN